MTGASGGFVGGFIGSGGDLKSAVIGGLTGGAAGYIGASGAFGDIGQITAKRVIAHGVVGGASSELRGGKFIKGFMSSAFVKSVSGHIESATNSNPIAGGVMAAVVGGASRVLGGGKFINGAMTSGFQYLFNQSMSQQDCKGQCHGVDGRDQWKMLSDRQHDALASGFYSSLGAGAAGVGCYSTGTTCGVMTVLSVDAVRQFNSAATGNDMIVDMATGLGATPNAAVRIAGFADFYTAVVSIRASINALFDPNAYKAAAFAFRGIDGASSYNSLRIMKENYGAP